MMKQHGPSTSIPKMHRGLQRPSRSEMAPKAMEDMTASIIGSVLMMPDWAGLIPCCCNAVGA